MKLLLFLVSLFSFQLIGAQCIYDYEQEIQDSSNLNFEEISFQNTTDKITLSGTLIFPKIGFEKMIIMVPGSGKDTRHSHFLLAEQFLKNNIAVYRFDERGIGKSKGKYDYTATTLRNDLIFAYQNLRHHPILKNKKIGVLGHSLGGIASIGAYGKGCDFDFLIQMGTPVQNDGAFIKYQASTNSDGFYSVKNKTTPEVVAFVDSLSKMVAVTADFKSMKQKGKQIMKNMGFKKALHLVVNPLQVDLIKQQHESTYKNATAPILFIIGSEDRIVSAVNETKILKSLNNSNVDIRIIDQVNHWLSDKLRPSKMEKALYKMNEKALNEIIHWTLEN